MVRPADLCHQWCHKCIVLVRLVKLFHAVKPAPVESFDTGILFGNIAGNLVNHFIAKSGVGA